MPTPSSLTIPPTGIAAAILAGGRGTRMREGAPDRDKRLLSLHGQPLLAHVVDRIAPQVDCGLLINGPLSLRDELNLEGLPLVPDQLYAGQGPLAGLLAALLWVSGLRKQAKWVVSVPADCPFLPADLVARLAAPIQADKALATCASVGHQRHPIIGLWSVDLLPSLRTAMDAGTRSMRDWAKLSGAEWVRWKAGEDDPFLNINTPDDLAQAERRPWTIPAPSGPELAA